jgi:hypothetical protein
VLGIPVGDQDGSSGSAGRRLVLLEFHDAIVAGAGGVASSM